MEKRKSKDRALNESFQTTLFVGQLRSISMILFLSRKKSAEQTVEL